MRVFVTGASGHIGSAVVPELLSAGHEVVGLARSNASAAALTAAGAVVRRGDLDDLRGLQEALRLCLCARRRVIVSDPSSLRSSRRRSVSSKTENRPQHDRTTRALNAEVRVR